MLCSLNHLVGPIAGLMAIKHARCDTTADAAQVLDQCKAQHDRDCPQLTERELGDGLISRNESRQAFKIDPPVAMCDDRQRNVVNARMPSRFATGKTGQLSAVAFREVPSGGTNLLFNQEIIVKQPFSGRRDALIRLYGIA